MSLSQKLKDTLQTDVKSIYIEPWDETIWVKPLTIGEVTKLQKKYPDFFTNMTGEAMVELILMKALNKDGEKSLSLEDKPILMRQSPAVIANVAGAILGSDVSEDYEKN